MARRPLPIPFLALLAGTACAATGDLNIGDPAPALMPAKWIKGEPVARFEKGHFYVVEFWATWCNPCREAIPHLTELAHQYRGKVDFVGVDVWEGGSPKEDPLPKVEAFVKARGDEMDYHVAADANDNRVADAWLKEAMEQGIPTAFVIDGEGKIEAIVHDPDDLAKVLPLALAGKIDVDAARAQRASFLAPWKAIQKAIDAKDYKGLVATVDALDAKDPAASQSYAFYLYVGLVHLDPATFEKRAREYLAAHDNSMDAYNMLCAVISNEKGVDKKVYRFGLTLALEGAKLKQREALFLSIASDLCEFLSDRAGALRYAEATVKSADADPNCGDSFRQKARKRLADLRSEKPQSLAN